VQCTRPCPLWANSGHFLSHRTVAYQRQQQRASTTDLFEHADQDICHH
jgi:hypothetical protein